MNSQIFLISSCANIIASYITSSGTSFAPASIITTFWRLPATVRLRSLFSRCSTVGLIMNSPSIRPTYTAAIGPLKGISETDTAADEPIIAQNSGALSCSTDITVETIDTSFLRSLGKRGLIGLSITRAVRIAFSEGLPSLFKKLPGILPTAYILSS